MDDNDKTHCLMFLFIYSFLTDSGIGLIKKAFTDFLFIYTKNILSAPERDYIIQMSQVH